MNIEIQALSISVDKKTLLDDIDLTIKPNELSLLIGPNGAGKSTLLKACSGDMPPSKGDVFINQKSIASFSPLELAKTRAVMTQSYQMGFNFTVIEVVSMGCFNYEEDISQVQKLDILQDVMHFMEIEHLAERSFMTLSGGEQQRTQLARVLAQLWLPYEQDEARYLFLDEPTSSLDVFHQYHVLSLAKALTKRNIGVLAVIHDLSLAASFADQLVLLNNGKMVTKGRPENVLQRSHLEKVYGIKAEYYHHSVAVKPSVLLDQQQ
ncbi:heme ABC transporter ATP-binding protein [Marinomonas rhizomae]|uniref:Iron complex transport system ATP-binding protein n=1 Tax=Marinomonas rhizomae TaxID=491948 RepID=A0A366IXX2_9GAMM|nr:heme ABC transporter ATP-binding protein [Marinomonas rhizomae]RBP79417.1 iron complex transport system ATP-binding protein [Marinomonas rhizomae]RNF71345.1 heme ABC transporter ATP-binding protein [Marinomonas rhizomae]